MAESKKVLEAKLAVLKAAHAKKVTASIREQIQETQNKLDELEGK